MRSIICGVAFSCMLAAAAQAWCQNAPPLSGALQDVRGVDPASPARQPPEGADPFAPQPPPAPPQLVAVEVEIIELAALETPLEIDPAKADAELLARVRDLSRTGALRMASRMRVTAVDGKPAMVQFGEEALVPNTARAVREGLRPAGPVSLSRTNLGTVVTVMPTVHDSGAIVVDYQIEKSYLSQPQHKMEAADEVDAELPAPRPQKISAKSTASVPDGKTVIFGGITSRASDGDSSQIVLLLTARIIKP